LKDLDKHTANKSVWKATLFGEKIDFRRRLPKSSTEEEQSPELSTSISQDFEQHKRSVSFAKSDNRAGDIELESHAFDRMQSTSNETKAKKGQHKRSSSSTSHDRSLSPSHESMSAFLPEPPERSEFDEFFRSSTAS
jgi:hypothetical protein